MTPPLLSNLLGDIRAESDGFLDRVFLETREFHAVTTTSDFTVVVGRRGSGKSAIYRKAGEYFRRKEAGYIIFSEEFSEEHSLEFERLLSGLSEYRQMRATARLAWRTHLLVRIVPELQKRWISEKLVDNNDLAQYCKDHRRLFADDSEPLYLSIARRFIEGTTDPLAIPSAIARDVGIEKLETLIRSTLTEAHLEVRFLFDKLDEGWAPTPAACAAVGGLLKAVSDFSEHRTKVHATAFLRDNMLRALARLDTDFSRNVEGGLLRITWDGPSLLSLVSERIRLVFDLKGVEKDTKAWNQVVQPELHGMNGFSTCLAKTLYRPRDILALLNGAWQHASREGRQQLRLADVQFASVSISKARLHDLLKEYDGVLAAIEPLILLFNGRAARARLETILRLLGTAIAGASKGESLASSDLAIVGTAEVAFKALYEVGFIGVEDPHEEGQFRFCYDGAAQAAVVDSDCETMVHPCYWEALAIDDTIDAETASEVNDEYETTRSPRIKQLRVEQLGQIVDNLDEIPIGKEGWAEFEDWCLRTIRILCASRLRNIESKPNGASVTRRDIVASVCAKEGFWDQVRTDYQSRQVVFECKNYKELEQSDIRQLADYLTNDYGRFGIVITRSEEEGMDETRRQWLRDQYLRHGKVCFVLPVSILRRALRKVGRPRKVDYLDEQLEKRLDVFVRRWASAPSGRPEQQSKR